MAKKDKGTKSGKASLAALNNLHAAVAKALTDAIAGKDCPATIYNSAINFLAKNEITVDIMESAEVRSLFQEVQKTIDGAEGIDSVEDMMEIYKDTL